MSLVFLFVFIQNWRIWDFPRREVATAAVQLSRTNLRYLECWRTSLYFVKAEAHIPRPFELQIFHLHDDRQEHKLACRTTHKDCTRQREWLHRVRRNLDIKPFAGKIVIEYR